MDAEALVRPLIEASGLELVDVVHARGRGRAVLQLVVDGPDLDLDALSELSERISRRLDLEEYGTGPYELQVSTPGLERALRRPEHFRRAIGERVRIRLRAPETGARAHEGELVDADDRGFVIRSDGGDLRLSHDDVASARTVVDWDAELKRSHA